MSPFDQHLSIGVKLAEKSTDNGCTMSTILFSILTDKPTLVTADSPLLFSTSFAEDLEARQLHVCPRCRAESVEAQNCFEMGPDSWSLTLQCPDCGWRETDMYDALEVELFEEQLIARG